MSGKHTSINKSVTSKQELQERWKQLDLKAGTLLHLQEVLDQRGLTAASTVTDVLSREKRSKVSDVSREWSLEELRLLSLESIRPHLVDLIRLLLESLVAWHFIIVPAGVFDGLTQIVLAILFILVGLFLIWVICRCRSARSHHPHRHIGTQES